MQACTPGSAQRESRTNGTTKVGLQTQQTGRHSSWEKSKGGTGTVRELHDAHSLTLFSCARRDCTLRAVGGADVGLPEETHELHIEGGRELRHLGLALPQRGAAEGEAVLLAVFQQRDLHAVVQVVHFRRDVALERVHCLPPRTQHPPRPKRPSGKAHNLDPLAVRRAASLGRSASCRKLGG